MCWFPSILMTNKNYKKNKINHQYIANNIHIISDASKALIHFYYKRSIDQNAIFANARYFFPCLLSTGKGHCLGRIKYSMDFCRLSHDVYIQCFADDSLKF